MPESPSAVRRSTSEHRQAAWAGWLLLGISFAFLCTLVANLACWYDFFDRSDVLYAQRYADDPKDYFEAKLLGSGMAYVGTCPNCDEGSEGDRCDEYALCDPGKDAEALCKEVLTEFVPLPVAFLDQNGRRLEQDEHAFRPSEDDSCFDKYRAWALVEFIVETKSTNNTFRRCAYTYGTRANSKQSGYFGDLAPPELTWHGDAPETLWVWTQRREDRCVVGLHMNMEDFVAKEIVRDKLAIVGALVSCCGLCFFACLFTGLSQVESNHQAYRNLILCQESSSSVERQYSPVAVTK